ncbi:MAG: helix-turn-helix domain-containing protein [Chitinophagaceae bacterium]
MKPYLVISLIGSFQGILLSLLFLLKSKKRPATLMLGLYVFTFSVGLLERGVANHSDFVGGKLLLSLIANSSLLYGPFLYLFVYYLTSGISFFQKRQLIHVFLFFAFFGFDVFIILSGFTPVGEAASAMELIGFEILVVQILAYNILAIKLLDRHYQTILSTYSAIEERDLRWLKRLLLIITSIYAFSFLLSHLAFFGIKAALNFFIIIQLAITFCIYLMSYMALLRPGMFALLKNIRPIAEVINKNEDVFGPQLPKEDPVNFEKYKKSGLKSVQASQYLSSLKTLMESDKPYMNPELNVHALSHLLGISKNHLTQVLNEHLEMNFFEFINMYRIEEAKKLMLSPAYGQLSLQGIATESGYKSKATFFSNFRKITGLTPLEWLSSQKKSG